MDYSLRRFVMVPNPFKMEPVSWFALRFLSDDNYSVQSSMYNKETYIDSKLDNFKISSGMTPENWLLFAHLNYWFNFFVNLIFLERKFTD